MQALLLTPGLAHSTRLAQIAPPAARPGSVLIRCLEVGVCGTDREMVDGHFGSAPAGAAELVIGHELLGEVIGNGEGFVAGDLVTATVRRSCECCQACVAGAPDACLTGDYSERGIKRLDGFAGEVIAELAQNVIAVPRGLGRNGVLAEPASICARAIRTARAVGERHPWTPRRALVLGAGGVGLLCSAFLRLAGISVWAVDRRPAGSDRAQLVQQLGGSYVCTAHSALADLREDAGPFDLIIEAAGNAQLMLDALALLARSGVMCVLGIDTNRRRVSVDSDVIGVDTVIANRAIVGSVNANRRDWVQGLANLSEVAARWPGFLEEMVTARFAPDSFADAFACDGVKATLCFGEIGAGS